MRAPSDKFIRRLIWILLALAIFFIGTAFYIPAKAMLSKTSLQRSWSRTIAEHGAINKPWPWSASWPVAKLQIPERGIDAFVLEGETLQGTNRGLASGMYESVDRNTGTIVINAVGDEYARNIGNIAPGEYLQFQEETGKAASYRVEDLQIIDMRYAGINMPKGGKWLMLIVHYPFKSNSNNSFKRYVVSALLAAQANNPAQDI